MENTKNGYYRHEGFFPQKGNEYKITASYDGYNTVEAKTGIPDEVPIISFDTSSVITYYEYGSDMEIHANIKYKDPPDVKNFYLLDCRVRNKSPEGEYFWYDNGLWIPETSQMLFDNDYGDILWSDEYSDGKEVTLDVGFMNLYIDGRNITELDTSHFVFCFKSITQEYYTYLKSLNIYYETGGSDNPFIEPVVIYSNVNEGYGILGGYNQDTATFDFIYDNGMKKGGAE
jgi:hypothetical protein